MDIEAATKEGFYDMDYGPELLWIPDAKYPLNCNLSFKFPKLLMCMYLLQL